MGSLIFSFIFINILFNVARNTFARVLTLLVAMGTGIRATSQSQRDRPKLIALSILYVCSNVAYLIAVQMNKTQPLSPTIQLGVSLPLSIANTLFFFWILKSLDETKKALLERQQHVKYEMMRRYTWILAAAYVVGVVTVFGEIVYKFQGDRDLFWRYEWIVESSWFIIFTGFLIAIMILMRPTERSRLLAHVEELSDTDRYSTNISSNNNNNANHPNINFIEG